MLIAHRTTQVPYDASRAGGLLTTRFRSGFRCHLLGLLPGLLLSLLLGLLGPGTADAQTFDSGSDGSDGALLLDGSGTVVFDPDDFTPALDPDRDGIYHFTTITIGPNVTVELRADRLGTQPVVWLATGDVVIDGNLDLSGEDGYSFGTTPIPAVAGAGGFNGGRGTTTTTGATPGEGPGGGGVGNTTNSFGGGAGHSMSGQSGGSGAGAGGSSYGNGYLRPLLGGSGGGGGGPDTPNGSTVGSGGGAGGGAILIASSTRIDLDGWIDADGGNGGGNFPYGGSGSGGSVRLVAGVLEGSGTITVDGPNNGTLLDGSDGRVRLEAFQHDFQGITHSGTRVATPSAILPPANAPRVRISSVAGQAAPANPLGSYAPADVVINESGPATIEVEASYVPLGTVVHLTLRSEEGDLLEVDTSPLSGTLEASTASASVTIPAGFSRFNVTATWTP